MLTHDELPPPPKFKVMHWAMTGIMAWSLFFGAVGGLGVLLLADYGPEKINKTRELKEDVATVDHRVTALEQHVQNEKHEEEVMPPVVPAPAPDTQLTKVLIGLTQLKTSYDQGTPLSDGIANLKKVVKDNAVLQNLNELQKVTADNFPSKEKIVDDLQALQASPGASLKNEKGEQPLDWKARAKMAIGQLVRVTPTKNITDNRQIERVQQAVVSGDYNLAQKFAAQLPNTPSAQMIVSEIAQRTNAENIVQKLVSQISSAIGGSQGSLY